MPTKGLYICMSFIYIKMAIYIDIEQDVLLKHKTLYPNHKVMKSIFLFLLSSFSRLF